MDMRTLILLAAFGCLNLSLILVYLRFTRQVYPGFGLWTAAAACFAMGFFLVGLRNWVPEVWPVWLSNASWLTALYLLRRGMDRFVGLPPRRLLVAFPLLVLFAAFTYFWLVTPDVNARKFLTAAAVVSILSWCIASAYRHFPAVLGERDYVFITGMAVIALVFLSRPLLVILSRPTGQDFMQPSPGALLAALGAFLGYLVMVLGLIKVNSQRLEYDLRRTQGEVKTLQGLLPMCPHCKKILDEEGRWHPLETYLQARSEAQVTHGLCPDCLRLLYPDLADGVLARLSQAKDAKGT
ncbi:MAG: hypothetical protein KQJ78_23050 [Deltaproteobacteria bacterium]|nr:hypothetical protein [Deltaproteobacteria bacterium]